MLNFNEDIPVSPTSKYFTHVTKPLLEIKETIGEPMGAKSSELVIPPTTKSWESEESIAVKEVMPVRPPITLG